MEDVAGASQLGEKIHVGVGCSQNDEQEGHSFRFQFIGISDGIGIGTRVSERLI
ncbi:MAG: hypothetical protein GY696_02795 [Gammaproteobacteria bacterium]|nr:hypothetical protein [Gammaproteobacteria bacterium]